MKILLQTLDGHQNKHALDSLRGIAVLSVFFAHLDNYFLLVIWPLSFKPIQANIGAFGVNIFFLLSGFLIWQSAKRLLVKKNGLMIYFIHRITRIYPLYLINIAFILMCSSFYIGYFKPDTSFVTVIRHLFFLQNFKPLVVTHLNGVYWTLVHEFIFYLLVPILFVLRIKVWHLVLTALLTQVLWHFYSDSLFGFVNYWCLFVGGMIIAETKKIYAHLQP